jgi:hypothetical protein
VVQALAAWFLRRAHTIEDGEELARRPGSKVTGSGGRKVIAVRDPEDEVGPHGRGAVVHEGDVDVPAGGGVESHDLIETDLGEERAQGVAKQAWFDCHEDAAGGRHDPYCP